MAPNTQGTCDAHQMVVDSLKEIKDDIKTIKNKQEELNDYIIEKKTENGIEKFSAQVRDTTWDNRRNWAIVIIAITSIAISLYTTLLK